MKHALARNKGAFTSVTCPKEGGRPDYQHWILLHIFQERSDMFQKRKESRINAVVPVRIARTKTQTASK